MNVKNLHKNFKINGKSIDTTEELLVYSKKLSPNIYSFLEDWFKQNDLINVQTSGSTGKPKVIVLKKEHMVNSAKATGTFFDLPENTKALLCLSANYIAGKMMLVRALTLGWHLDIVDASSSPLEQHHESYDFCAMVPMQVIHSLTDLHRIKKLIIGGGVVNQSILEQLQSVSTEVYATYGMTETITHIAIKKLNSSGTTDLISTMHYKTLPGVTITTDLRGCLIIEAPKVSEEKIITNDLVEIISDSTFNWLGRVDNIINSGGVKLVPEQIENKLAQIIEQRFFVAGIADDILGEKLILIIEDDSSFTVNEVKKSIAKFKLLSNFETPKAIYFIEKFVDTETKKINRKATIEMIEN